MPGKNNHFRSLFSLLFIFVVVDSKNDCLIRFCGKNKSLPIYYPFQLEGDKHQKGCDQNQAVNLKCSNQDNVPVLNLPSSGDFYVRNINYTAQIIQLYDPNNCLPALFMNSNFSVSPLMAINYRNYTFYNCPSNATRSNFTSIGCLSNSTFSTLSTSSILRANELNGLGCNTIQTAQIPVSYPLQYEYNGFNNDLQLTWNVSNCEVCKNIVKRKRNAAGRILLILFFAMVLPSLICLFLYILSVALVALIKIIIKYIRLIKRKIVALTTQASDHRAQGDSISSQIRLPVITAPPRRINIDSVMNTIVVGESRRVPGPNSNTCPICLEDYNPRDTIKCSPNCEHYFHATCIDLWLRTHNSCPVCRTIAP